MPHFRPILRAAVLLKLGGEIFALVLALVFVWGDHDLNGKRIYTAILCTIFLWVAWVVIRAPYCYFFVHPSSLIKGATALKFVRYCSGHIPELQHSVIRYGADIIADRSAILEGDKIVHNISGSQKADIEIPIRNNSTYIDLEFQCTAGADGWKQRFTLRRQKDRTWKQDEIVIRPDFPKWKSWYIYPERKFDARGLFFYVPTVGALAFLLWWAWPPTATPPSPGAVIVNAASTPVPTQPFCISPITATSPATLRVLQKCISLVTLPGDHTYIQANITYATQDEPTTFKICAYRKLEKNAPTQDAALRTALNVLRGAEAFKCKPSYSYPPGAQKITTIPSYVPPNELADITNGRYTFYFAGLLTARGSHGIQRVLVCGFTQYNPPMIIDCPARL